jgi:hypothetical protein
VQPPVPSRAELGQASVLGSEHGRCEEAAHDGALLVANGKVDARGLGRGDLASLPDGASSHARRTYLGRDVLPEDMASRAPTRARDPDSGPCPQYGLTRSDSRWTPARGPSLSLPRQRLREDHTLRTWCGCPKMSSGITVRGRSHAVSA